jgi:hypothetical protein
MKLDLVVKFIKYVFRYIIPHIFTNSYVIFEVSKAISP